VSSPLPWYSLRILREDRPIEPSSNPVKLISDESPDVLQIDFDVIVDESTVAQAAEALSRDARIELLEGRGSPLGRLREVNQVEKNGLLGEPTLQERDSAAGGVPLCILRSFYHRSHPQRISRRFARHIGTASVTT
jgi:hypothetical protein